MNYSLIHVLRKWGFHEDNFREHKIDSNSYDEMHKHVHYHGLCTLKLYFAFDHYHDQGFSKLGDHFHDWNHLVHNLTAKL